MSSREVSVVIPTFNRSRTLLRVLRALEAQTVGPQAFEVFVVDDGSQDGTPSAVEQFAAQASLELRYIRQQNSGPAAARNRGIAASKGALVVFLGDDTIPAPEFLEEHLRYHGKHADNQKLAVVGYTAWLPGMVITPFMRYIGEAGPQFAYRWMQTDVPLPFLCFYSSNVSVPRALLEAVEYPFDEDFTDAMWEDTELGYRLAKQGMQLHFHPAAVAYHDHPTNLAQFCRRASRVGAVSRLMIRKHPELAKSLFGHALLRRLSRAIAMPLVPVADFIDRRLRLPLPDLFYRAIVAVHYAEGAASAATRKAAMFLPATDQGTASSPSRDKHVPSMMAAGRGIS